MPSLSARQPGRRMGLPGLAGMTPGQTGAPATVALHPTAGAPGARPSGQPCWPGRQGVSTNRPARQRVRPLPSGGTTPRAPRRLPKGSSLLTPNASPARQAIERHSARPLLYLHQLPAWVLPVMLAVLLVVGLAVRGLV